VSTKSEAKSSRRGTYPPVEGFEFLRRRLALVGHLGVNVEVQRQLGYPSEVVGLEHGEIVQLVAKEGGG
jgi:hypothetical protein